MNRSAGRGLSSVSRRKNREQERPPDTELAEDFVQPYHAGMPDRKRVLFAIGSMGGGGSERQMLGLLKHLDRTRFVPLLYLIYRQGELLADVPADVPIFAFSDRARLPRWNFPGRNHRLRVADLAAVLREQQVDLIYDRTLHMTLITSEATRRFSVPRISVAVADPRVDLDLNAQRFRSTKRRLMRRGYREATQVWAVSEGVRKALIEYYDLPPECIHTVYNFLDIDRIDRLSQLDPPPFETDRFHVVAAGRLQVEKGYPYLIEAVSRIVERDPQTPLLVHILGQGPLQAELQALIEVRKLTGHIRLEGFVENPYPYFRRADLFCLPSLYDGMPNSLLEAIACEVPVVATACPGGVREILDNGRFGELVLPSDSATLASALEDALSNPVGWRSRAKSARKHLEQSFGLAAGMTQLEERFAAVAK